MSYVLDALKKADADRRRHLPGTATTIHAEPARTSIRGWLVAAVISLNLCGWFWFMQSQGGRPGVSGAVANSAAPPAASPSVPYQQVIVIPPGSQAVVGPVATGNAAEAPVSAIAKPPPAVMAPDARLPPASAVPPPVEVDLSQPIDGRLPAAPDVTYLPQLEELPASVRSKLPAMTFSSHMYSTQTEFRSVVINGARRRTGDWLADDVQLVEITGNGVVMTVGGTPFQVDVLGKWAH